jgi:hypothetical protein
MNADDGSDVTRLTDNDADDRDLIGVLIHQLLVMMMIRTNMIVRKSIMMTMQKINTSFFCAREKSTSKLS